MYNLIGVYQVWRVGKTHICKENGTIHTMCGKELGFDYGIITNEGYENGTDKEFSREADFLQRKIFSSI